MVFSTFCAKIFQFWSTRSLKIGIFLISILTVSLVFLFCDLKNKSTALEYTIVGKVSSSQLHNEDLITFVYLLVSKFLTPVNLFSLANLSLNPVTHMMWCSFKN